MVRAWFSCAGSLLVGSVALGCSDDGTTEPPPPPPDAGPELPARICKPPAPEPSVPWFSDVTAELGLNATPELEPVGNCIVGADLDGDSFVDLLAARGESDRGLVGDKRARFLLVNRPAGEDPAGRRFQDVPDLGGLLQTRD